MSHLPPSETESLTPDFSGSSFVVAREQLGLSAVQVAAELRLSLEQVEALETGNFSKLPSVVFTRGYIRAYAKLVKLDGDELVRQYERCHGGERATTPIRTVARVRPSASSGPVTFGSLMLLVLVVVGATFWWWQTQYGHEVAADNQPEPTVAVDTADGETLVFNTPDSESEVAPLTAAPDDADVQATETAVGEASNPAALSIENASSVAIPQTEAVAAEPVAEAVAPATAVAEPEPEPEAEVPALAVAHGEGLYLSFSDDCWVTIKDASGKTLFNNLRKAGQELHLPQNGPMNVLLGRVSAVSEITFDGTAVDLAPFNNKNVARLRLPVAQ